MKLDLSGLKLKKKDFIYYKALWFSVFKGSEMVMKNGKLATKPDGSNSIHQKKDATAPQKCCQIVNYHV